VAGQAELYFPPQPAGLDPFSARASFDLVNTKGFIAQGRPINQNLTLNYDGTITHAFSPTLVSNSSFGVQYLADAFHRTDAFGQDLGSTGIRSVSSAAVTTGREQDTTQKSIGVYVQEQAAWRDHLFVTAALRVDNNSAFGADLRRVFYPKASVSYVVSEEPFFHVPSVNELRLRFAIPAGERYLWNFVTLPSHRGLGIYPRLLNAIVSAESTESDRFWIAYAPENRASGSGIRKAGFVTVAELSFDMTGRPALRAVAPDEVAAARMFGVPMSDDLSACWRCARAAASAQTTPTGCATTTSCCCDYQRPEVTCAA